jgi:hypothetical protein
MKKVVVVVVVVVVVMVEGVVTLAASLNYLQFQASNNLTLRRLHLIKRVQIASP